jgi:hypothetical protein
VSDIVLSCTPGSAFGEQTREARGLDGLPPTSTAVSPVEIGIANLGHAMVKSVRASTTIECDNDQWARRERISIGLCDSIFQRVFEVGRVPVSTLRLVHDHDVAPHIHNATMLLNETGAHPRHVGRCRTAASLKRVKSN